jgi:ABC-type lipoprotein release transport system permease subunit
MILISLAFKDLVSEPKRLLSYILTIGSLIAVAVIPLAVGNAYIEQLMMLIPRQEYHYYLVVNSSANSLSDSLIDYKFLENMLNLKNVDYSPQIIRRCNVASDVGSVVTFLRGADLNQLYKFRGIGLRGRIPMNVSEANVGILLAERLNLSINDHVEVEISGRMHVFKVAGILRCNCLYDEEVLIQLGEAWTLMPDLKGKITLIELSGEIDPQRLAYLNIRAIPLQPASQAVTGIVESTFNTIRNWALAIFAMVFASSYFASLKMCVDSIDRVTILRSIGFSKKRIALFLFYKAMTASLISILVGISIGIVASQAIFRAATLVLSIEAYRPPTLTLSDLYLVLTVVGILSVTGSVPSIIRVARMRV